MNWGDFREFFRGFGWKRLTSHEVDPAVSNGHEFQGVGRLRTILGTESAERLSTTYVLLRDDSEEPDVLKLWSKWYDSRLNDPDRSAEWRLYYPAEAGQIQARMKAGDLMVLAVTTARELLILLAAAGSESERRLGMLFGFSTDETVQLQVRPFDQPVALDFIGASILEELGIGRVHAPAGGDAGIVATLVEELSSTHPTELPVGHRVAELVRERLVGVDALQSPDEALFRWIEAEAAMFRAWEDQKIGARIASGFLDDSGAPDVESFRRFSMSIRQSRVSRAGGALQYHFRALLDARGLEYVMEPKVDGGEIPDFLFPSKAAYEDLSYPSPRLRMLAAKFTAKDRWRQVLNEAKRIEHKHLLTMEPTITRNQMRLMSDAKLTLVIPSQIRARYPDAQKAEILEVASFIEELAELQRT